MKSLNRLSATATVAIVSSAAVAVGGFVIPGPARAAGPICAVDQRPRNVGLVLHAKAPNAIESVRPVESVAPTTSEAVSRHELDDALLSELNDIEVASAIVGRTTLDVRIHGVWYDLSRWRKAHPAGAHWIDWYDGRDATEVMDAFHSAKARKMWSRLPRSSARSEAMLASTVPEDSEAQKNFRALREQLEADGWWERDIFRECRLIGIWVAMAIGAAATAHTDPFISISLTSLCFTQAGWLGHDYIHGVDKWSDRLRFFCPLCAGLGITWWSDKHNKHHALTNEMGVDEDIATDPFLYSWAPDPEHDSPLRKFQHIWFFVPFSALFALWRYDTIMVTIDSIEEKRPETKKELLMLMTHYLVVLSFLPPSVWIPAIFVSGLISALIVTPTHQSEAIFEEYQADWVTAQFTSTRNAVTNNPFSEWIWGGMQYQLEHHLFPSMPRSKYPALRPILQKFADDNRIPGGYRESGEFEILYMNWKLYRDVANADPVPGAPYSRGHGQLGAIDSGNSPAAGGIGGKPKP